MLVGPAPEQLGRVDRVIFRKAARERAVGRLDRDEVTARNAAGQRRDARGKQARALAHRRCRARIDVERTPVGQPAGQPRLARGGGALGDKQCVAVVARQRSFDAAAGDGERDAGGRRDPCRLQL